MTGTVSGELFAGIVSALAVLIALLAAALAKVRERVARLEEWVRLNEPERP